MIFFDTGDARYNFVSCFLPNMRHQFGNYAKGYKNAADVLARILLDKGTPRDYDCYPVVFAYRQAFELHLKSIIYGLLLVAGFKRMDNVDGRLWNCHALSSLASTAGDLLLKAFPEDQEIGGMVQAFRETADVFSQVDPNSFSYRYPINKTGHPATPKNQTLNLQGLAEHMSALLEQMEILDFGINVELDNAQDVYELGQTMWPDIE